MDSYDRDRCLVNIHPDMLRVIRKKGAPFVS
jgi:hypothetical protein